MKDTILLQSTFIISYFEHQPVGTKYSKYAQVDSTMCIIFNYGNNRTQCGFHYAPVSTETKGPPHHKTMVYYACSPLRILLLADLRGRH